MGYSRFQAGILIRLFGLVMTLTALAWIALNTGWYVTMALFTAAVAGPGDGADAFRHPFGTRSGAVSGRGRL